KSFNGSEIQDLTVTCFFRTWMLPLLLFLYLIVSSVLLVNLVTSFFTITFDQVRDSSLVHYRYKLYKRLVEFEVKLRVPPPLSIFYYIYLCTLHQLIKCFRTVCCIKNVAADSRGK
ncbi:hypothetical protein PFISCL1PPCAC_10278, partial [Pristionchus fissidentatus]